MTIVAVALYFLGMPGIYHTFNFDSVELMDDGTYYEPAKWKVASIISIWPIIVFCWAAYAIIMAAVTFVLMKLMRDI